jgi:hypothetical protein
MEYVIAFDIFKYLVVDLGLNDLVMEEILLSNELRLGPEINGKITINVEDFIKLINKYYD